MKEFKFLDTPEVIKYIQSLDEELLTDPTHVIGSLFIDYLDDAGMELMDLPYEKYLDYLFRYIFTERNAT